MKRIALPFLIIFGLSLLVAACAKKSPEGGKEKAPGKAGDAWSAILVDEFEGSGLKKNSEIRTFGGDALWEYIDGGADVYLAHNFIEVATADYREGSSDYVADVYRFQTAGDAYGMYTRLRSPDAEIVDIGVEGFVAPGSLIFNRGEWLVRLTGYDTSDEGTARMNELARLLNARLTGTSEPPPEQ